MIFWTWTVLAIYFLSVKVYLCIFFVALCITVDFLLYSYESIALDKLTSSVSTQLPVFISLLVMQMPSCFAAASDLQPGRCHMNSLITQCWNIAQFDEMLPLCLDRMRGSAQTELPGCVDAFMKDMQTLIIIILGCECVSGEAIEKADSPSRLKHGSNPVVELCFSMIYENMDYWLPIPQIDTIFCIFS